MLKQDVRIHYQLDELMYEYLLNLKNVMEIEIIK